MKTPVKKPVATATDEPTADVNEKPEAAALKTPDAEGPEVVEQATSEGEDATADLLDAVAAIAASDAPSLIMPPATDVQIVGATGIRVDCLVETGRRRAGRRWDAGETIIQPGELTDYELAQLRGDPLFRVTLPAAPEA